jgi:hypothetical protein
MDVQALVGTTGAGTAAGAAAPAPATPATPPVASDASHVMGEVAKKAPGGIASAIAKLYGGDSNAHISEPAVNVSYKIEGKTIHTVFTDPTTGQEIAQFPPDLLQHIAAFFDASQGATLDKEA